MRNTTKQDKLSLLLTTIYLAAVSAVILFKFPFRGDDFGTVRVIELIPFYVSEIHDVSFFVSNIVYNFLFFIPFGVFVCLLKPKWMFAKKIVVITLLSLSFEVVQFVLGIGISDTTDLITNTTGGITGVGLYRVMQTIFKDKTHTIINVVALILTVVMLMLFGAAYGTMIR
ncbi:VanZ family protein [Clostridia bacterium]|nr:VanZ family protein [Clostridia bacterium]